MQTLDNRNRSDSHWHVLYTRHQHEKVIASALSNKGFHVFLPLYLTVRRWAGRQKELSLPLFPGYVFIKGGLERQLMVLTTPGIHMILMTAGRAAVVPDAELDSIRRAVESPHRVEPHPFLKCGDRVRVRSGSLEGLEGVLIRKKNLFRLVLSVELLAQSAAVEVDAATVESVSQNVPVRTSLQERQRIPMPLPIVSRPTVFTSAS
jgi:transcription antitermination factor NusG